MKRYQNKVKFHQRTYTVKESKKKTKRVTRESNRSVIWSLYALKMSADVMQAVLHTALLGFFSDFTTSGTTFSLLRNYHMSDETSSFSIYF